MLYFPKQETILTLLLFLSFLSGCHDGVKKRATCAEGLMLFKEECLKKEEIESQIKSEFSAIDEWALRPTATAEEIEKHIGPLFKKYMLDCKNWEVNDLFSKEVHKRAKKRDEKGLRLLLNMRYYHDEISRARFAEISEGWRDAVIFYIEEKPDLVIEVARDKKQLHKEVIEDAFFQYIDMFQVHGKSREIIDKRFTQSHKLLMEIIKEERFSQ